MDNFIRLQIFGFCSITVIACSQCYLNILFALDAMVLRLLLSQYFSPSNCSIKLKEHFLFLNKTKWYKFEKRPKCCALILLNQLKSFVCVFNKMWHVNIGHFELMKVNEMKTRSILMPYFQSKSYPMPIVKECSLKMFRDKV
jgi:hypothetical protein